MLSVLNVGHNYRVTGGSDRYFLALESLLTQHGVRVVPFAAAHPDNQPTPWSKYFPEAPDQARPGVGDAMRFMYSAAARRCMEALLDATQIDVAHLHIYYGQLTASILEPLRRRGIPIVQTLHEYKAACPVYTFVSNGTICEACCGGHYWHAIARRCNRRSVVRSVLSASESYVSRSLGALDLDHYIAVSDFVRHKMIEHGLDAGRLTTVHNFVDANEFEPGDGSGGYFLFLGRLEEVKGLLTLLEAAREVPGTPLLIVGDGSLRPRLEEIVRAGGLDHVRLLGFRSGDELRRLVRESICTILPSEWYETFGLTLAESLAAARPVIASRIGGIPEVVEDGRDGVLFPPGDVKALAAAMRFMREDPERASAMGRRGRDKVNRVFGRELHFERVMQVYQRVLR